MVANMQHFGKKDNNKVKNAQLMMRAERALMMINALGDAVLIDTVLEHVDPQRLEAFVVPLERAAQALENIARKPI